MDESKLQKLSWTYFKLLSIYNIHIKTIKPYCTNFKKFKLLQKSMTSHTGSTLNENEILFVLLSEKCNNAFCLNWLKKICFGTKWLSTRSKLYLPNFILTLRVITKMFETSLLFCFKSDNSTIITYPCHFGGVYDQMRLRFMQP